jgi:hypothetical protein
VTLLNGKVSAQVEVISSCSPRCAAYNPNITAGSERKGHALFDSENDLICIRNPSLETKM